MRHKFGLIRVTGFLLLFICFICFCNATTSKADDALYDIKEHGRDGYRLYNDL